MCHLILFLPFFAVPLFWIFPFVTALPLYLLVLGISLFLYFKIFQAMRQKVKTGQEAMLGKKGLVVEDIDPEGKIQYANEIWDATARESCFFKGEQVKIREIHGLVLQVEKMPGES
jgi:membrane-bound serine protease (ClpP class)